MRITIPLVSPVKNAGALRVAVIPRLVPALSYGLAVAGAGISALLVRQAFYAMRDAERAGIGVVAQSLAEGNTPVLVALYLAILGGVAGMLILIARMFMDTTTSSPPVWFFLVAGMLGMMPGALFWWTESLIIGALYPGSNIMTVAETVSLLLPAIMIAAPIILLLLLAISVWPVRSLSKPKWGPLAALLLVELALIAMAVAFQIRTSWLLQVAQAERLLP